MSPSRRLKITLLFAMVATAAIVPMPTANADHHFMLISEVFLGSGSTSQAQYVELVAYADGQNFVGGEKLTIRDKNGDFVDDFTFPSDLAGTFGDQDRILIGTSAVGTLFSVTPDLVMDAASIPTSGGKICFAGTVDCFFYGDYKPTIQEGQARPFARKSSTPLLSPVHRRTDLDGSGGTYSGGDDLNDPSFDFSRGDPSPANSAGAEGTPTGGVVSFSMSESFPLESEVEFPIVVNRSGIQSEPVSVKVKVVPVRSEPGVDFLLPDPNPDVIDFPGSETIKEFGLQLLDDEVPEPYEGVRLQLSNPGGGAVLGARSKMRLFFQDDDPDSVAPVTTIRRPKRGETYPDLNSVYGDVVDEGHGSAEIGAAIRRNMKDGSCRWLKKDGSFVSAACSKIKFFDDFAGTNYLYAPVPGNLPSSVGTGTKNYTAFARSIDSDGNTENSYELGRNKNTFEIK